MGKITCQGVEKISQLVRVLVEIRVGDHARDVLAVEVVVGGVDVPDTPVRVVVAVGAGTEGASSPHRGRLPVVLIVAENTLHCTDRL